MRQYSLVTPDLIPGPASSPYNKDAALLAKLGISAMLAQSHGHLEEAAE